MEDALNIQVKKNVLPLLPGDVLETSADTKALYEVTGFKPETTIKGRAKSFIDWHRGFYKA